MDLSRTSPLRKLFLTFEILWGFTVLDLKGDARIFWTLHSGF